jgi:hypothetical protein
LSGSEAESLLKYTSPSIKEVSLRLARILLFPLLIVALLFSLPQRSRGATSVPDFISELEPNERATVLVSLCDHDDISSLKLRLLTSGLNRARIHREIVSALKRRTVGSQSNLVDYLRQHQRLGFEIDYRAFWISNTISVRAPKEELQIIAALPEVKRLFPDLPITLIEPLLGDNCSKVAAGPESGLKAIGAPEAWAQGYTGAGRLVCSFDTGVDGDHPALSSRYRGDNGGSPEACWFDPYTNTDHPRDERGHGTHTMGIMCGAEGADTVGVAIGAQWIAAGVVDRGGGLETTISDILAAFEWAVDPDGDPETFYDVPDVICNSWGVPLSYLPACDQTFWEAIDNVEACGVVVIFAAGNEGPKAQSLRTPADRATSPTNSFAVGAVNAHEPHCPIAYFSSRGPSGCDGITIKPEATAPGYSIRSCFLNGEYLNLSGTSMAAPHVAGAVAILREFRPEATVEEIKTALMVAARDLGTAGEDNSYGWGLIDIPGAMEFLINPSVVTFNSSSQEFPEKFSLLGNYPNPFNPCTRIAYRVNEPGVVTLEVLNLLGEQVTILESGYKYPGQYVTVWNSENNGGDKVSSGLYFYRVKLGEEYRLGRMTLVR